MCMENLEDAEGEVFAEREAAVKELPDTKTLETNSLRNGKILALKETTARQRELEQERERRIQIEMEYLNEMMQTVNDNLAYIKEEQDANAKIERQIQTEVYRMHGISEDKLQGMEERTKALYQGAAFALLFL